MAIKQMIKRNVNANNMLLSNAFDRYITEKEIAIGLSSATINVYKGCYQKFITFIGENKVCNDIKIDVILDWIKDMKKSGNKYISINHYSDTLHHNMF